MISNPYATLPDDSFTTARRVPGPDLPSDHPDNVLIKARSGEYVIPKELKEKLDKLFMKEGGLDGMVYKTTGKWPEHGGDTKDDVPSFEDHGKVPEQSLATQQRQAMIAASNAPTGRRLWDPARAEQDRVDSNLKRGFGQAYDSIVQQDPSFADQFVPPPSGDRATSSIDNDLNERVRQAQARRAAISQSMAAGAFPATEVVDGHRVLQGGQPPQRAVTPTPQPPPRGEPTSNQPTSTNTQTAGNAPAPGTQSPVASPRDLVRGPTWDNADYTRRGSVPWEAPAVAPTSTPVQAPQTPNHSQWAYDGSDGRYGIDPIYRGVTPNGVVEFTDQPRPGYLNINSQAIPLEKRNTREYYMTQADRAARSNDIQKAQLYLQMANTIKPAGEKSLAAKQRQLESDATDAKIVEQQLAVRTNLFARNLISAGVPEAAAASIANNMAKDDTYSIHDLETATQAGLRQYLMANAYDPNMWRRDNVGLTSLDGFTVLPQAEANPVGSWFRDMVSDSSQPHFIEIKNNDGDVFRLDLTTPTDLNIWKRLLEQQSVQAGAQQ